MRPWKNSSIPLAPTNQPDIHYTLLPKDRINWPELSGLIGARKYFILHAPRQTGKTSLLINLMHFINAQGRYRALYVNIEAAQAARSDVSLAVASMVQALASAARFHWHDPQAEQVAMDVLSRPITGEGVRLVLQTWSEQSDKPLVIFFEEVDALVGDALISLRRQIRAGYAQRPEAFTRSMVLCGVRDFTQDNVSTCCNNTPTPPDKSLSPACWKKSGKTPMASPGWSTRWLMKPAFANPSNATALNRSRSSKLPDDDRQLQIANRIYREVLPRHAGAGPDTNRTLRRPMRCEQRSPADFLP